MKIIVHLPLVLKFKETSLLGFKARCGGACCCFAIKRDYIVHAGTEHKWSQKEAKEHRGNTVLRRNSIVEIMGLEEETQEDRVSTGRFTSYFGCFTLFIKREKLIIAVFASVILGFIVGMSINGKVQEMKEPDRTTLLTVLNFPGELLVRMLRMLVLPLIVCSLIVGLAGLEKHASGRVGRRAVLFYLSTTLIAAVLGLLIVVTIQPGKSASVQSDLEKQPSARTLDSFLDLLRFVD